MGRQGINLPEETLDVSMAAAARFVQSISQTIRHPGVIALVVAGVTIAAMLIVDHGPWSRAKTQPAQVAQYATTGEAARAAGAQILPTEPKSPIEPARPKTSPAINPVTP
jgi:hypothetical protein